MKTSKKSECDGFEDSIEITVPPMGVAVFTCTEERLPVKGKKPAVKKTAEKKVEKPAAKTTSGKGCTKKA